MDTLEALLGDAQGAAAAEAAAGGAREGRVLQVRPPAAALRPSCFRSSPAMAFMALCLLKGMMTKIPSVCNQAM